MSNYINYIFPLSRRFSTHFLIQNSLIKNKYLKNQHGNFCTQIKLKMSKKSTQNFHPTIESIANDKIEKNRVNFTSLNELVNNINVSSLSKNEISLLINSCGNLMPNKLPVDRIAMLNKIWTNIVICKNLHKDDDLLLEYIKIYSENQAEIKDVELENLLKSNKKEKFYNSFIQMYCECGNISKSLNIIADMKQHNFPITEDILNSLIRAYSKMGDIKQCEQMFNTVINAGLTPTIPTYVQILSAMIENGEHEKASTILTENSHHFSSSQCLYLLKIASISKQGDYIPKLLQLHPENIILDKNIDLALQNLLIELVHKGCFSEIYIILNNLPKPQYQSTDDIDTYCNFLIYEFIKSNQSHENILFLCKYLTESTKNIRAIHIACEISFKEQDVELSKSLLNELKFINDLRCHYFWPLLISGFKKSGESELLKILKLMKELEIELDYETITTYVLPKLSLNVEKPERTIEIFKQIGVTTAEILPSLVTNLIIQGRIGITIDILTKYKTTKLELAPLLSSLILYSSQLKYNRNYSKLAQLIFLLQSQTIHDKEDFAGKFFMEIILHSNKIDFKTFSELLRESCKRKIKISNTSCNILINNFNKRFQNETNFKDTVAFIKSMSDQELKLEDFSIKNIDMIHPRDMNLEQLKCHLIELNSKNMNTRGLLRRLLQLSVREGKLEEAVEYKTKCDELQVDLSPGMLASIVELNIKLKKLTEAKNVLDELSMKYPGFIIDDHKIIDLAALAIENNNIELAYKLLKTKSNVKGGLTINKNIWNLLNCLASLESTKLSAKVRTYDFLKFLQQHGYCNLNNNTLLGPVIREHLLKYDLKSAVTLFIEFATKYKKTPLLLELVTTLIQVSNQNSNSNLQFNMTKEEAQSYLEQIINTSSQIHGIKNLNITMVIALSEAGTKSQLRKFLMNPSNEIDADQLLKQCLYLAQQKKIKPLLNLAKSVEGLGHINVFEIYNVILEVYDKQNNCESALSLIEHLIDNDNVPIPQNFTKNIVNLFTRNKFDIPTRVLVFCK